MKKPVKIAIISPMIGYRRRGAGAIAPWIIEALKKDYDLYLITTGRVDFSSLNECWGTFIKPDEIKVVHLPQYFLRYTSNFTVLRNALLGRFCKQKASEFDVMFSTYNVMDFGKRGIQYIADFLFSDEIRHSLYRFPKKRGKGWFYGKSLGRAAYLKLGELLYKPVKESISSNLTLVNSEWSRNLAKRAQGLESIVVYPPVVGNPFSIPWDKRENGFVCIGKLVPFKEIEKAIEILARVREKGRDVHLHIIGWIEDSYYAQKIASLCSENSSWCFYEGEIFGDDKMRFIAQHKFGLNTCPNEAFGVAVAEMVHSGCLAFVPQGGGQVEIVNHPDLTYETVEDAVFKIDRILADEETQQELRIHLAGQGKKFEIAQFKSQIREVIEQFLNNKTIR